MKTGEFLDCPWCNFTDRDHYFLLQHVETIHPEGGRPSPFAIREEVTHQSEPPSEEMEEMEGARDCSSEYIECQCREFCLLTEFESHLEMHYAEGMGFDEPSRTSADVAAPASNIYPGKTASPPMEIPSPSPLHVVTSGPSRPIPIKPAVERSHLSTSRRRGNAVRDFIGVLRHSTSPPPPRKSSQATRNRVPRRLGRAELGPHAHEEKMPDWLRKELEIGAKVKVINQITPDGRLLRIENIANEVRGIVPVIMQLCEQDPTVSRAYLCHSDVTHVVKLAKEGGFCGYRNIQMMISYIRDARSDGYEHFQGRLPSIIQIQDMIERAWDRGFSSLGRIETGGIRGTRKYIGTPEAQALLQNLGIGCSADAFNEVKELPTHDCLLEAVEQYFLASCPSKSSQKVCRTSLPPIYFQHPGHSMTIVGFERRNNGSCDLLVLDPMFKPSPGVSRFIGVQFRTATPEKLLKAYRRGSSYLRRYSTFEILK
ncbi:MAG: hypothetical protein ALECFALPRED_005462 [Alectoria fallacina]|uniref:UFSP1/2/DUB catalytic domain-containing protein n=1 Tax=Alectoria fallacina TaxID=1903189 RepID=A0A8H3G4S8_9LECA|nr:MAG: hypothetical protein ALECFALPRED_005462 [Alectoria fallacina]